MNYLGINQNTQKTHCIRGHEFTIENTYLSPTGKRGCRACRPNWKKKTRALCHSDRLHKAHGLCENCYNKKRYKEDERFRERLKARARESHGRHGRKWYLKGHFGLTEEDYNRLLQQQNHGCAICLSPNPMGKGSFHVDHDHQTGLIRGLLCHSCNTGLGHFGDSEENLMRAIDYLKRAVQ